MIDPQPPPDPLLKALASLADARDILHGEMVKPSRMRTFHDRLSLCSAFNLSYSAESALLRVTDHADH